MMPTTGRSGSAGRPKVRSRSALHAALPDRSSGEYVPRDVRGRARGSHSVVVHAVQDPDQVRRARAQDRRRCRSPSPRPGSRARTAGETAVTSSEKRMPPFMKLTPPSNSSPPSPAAEVPGQAEHVHRVGGEVPLVGEVVDGEDAWASGRARGRPSRTTSGTRAAGRRASRGRGRRRAARRGCGSTRWRRGRGTRSAAGCRRSRRGCRRRRIDGRSKNGRVLDEDHAARRRSSDALEVADAAVHGVRRGRGPTPPNSSGRERDVAVAREEHRHPVAERGQRLRQRADDVGQPARLDERRHLGRRRTRCAGTRAWSLTLSPAC